MPIWKGVHIHREYPPYCCQLCGECVGYIGRLFDAMFGVRWHGCKFTNVKKL